MNSILVIHGPNLNLLGTREPEIYGSMTMQDINDDLQKQADEAGVHIDFSRAIMKGKSSTNCTKRAADTII